MLFFLFFVSSSSMDTTACRSLICDNVRNVSNFYDVCLSNRTNNSFTVHPCRPGSVCDSDFFNNVSDLSFDVGCLPIFQNYSCQGDGSLSLGRRCCTNTDCNTGDCYNLLCTGNTPCIDDEDCSFDSYCDSGVCLPSVAIGKACSRDAECKAGSGCNYKNCTQLLSLDDGSKVESQKFCISNFTDNGICESVIIYVNRTLQASPYDCYARKDYCNYTLSVSNKSIALEPCICGGNSTEPIGYCSRYVIYTKDWAANMHSYLKYDKSNCGGIYKSMTNPDILLECGSISKMNYLAYIRQYSYGRFWNLYQSGVLDNCAYTMNIYDPKAVFGMALVVSFIMLLI